MDWYMYVSLKVIDRDSLIQINLIILLKVYLLIVID